MSATSAHDAPHAGFGAPARPIPTGVQVLSTILFGAFAISVTAIAFAHFWPAGVGLALVLGWRGGFVPLMGRGPDHAGDQAREIIDSLRTLSPEARARSSRNASFDAYRADTLHRLEEEQESFSAFLERLRDARDQRQFDTFLDDRAEAARLPEHDSAGA